MIRVDTRMIELVKRYPLAISRGTQASSENLFVEVSDGELKGIGELSPAIGSGWTAERGQSQIEAFVSGSKLFKNGPPAPHEAWDAMREAELDPPAMAALDIAIWDLLAKQAGMPLYRLLGLPKSRVATSVTIGLNPPEVTHHRVPEILRRTGAKSLKIKLGSPEGREFDKVHFLAAAEAAKPFGVQLRVDANGGWTITEALSMAEWLADHGVDYIEQPLAKGEEAGLEIFSQLRPLPIFVDESCCFAADVPRLARWVDGINLKLMKCGGITEALRIVAVSRAHGLKTMIGCMSESSIAIAAGAAIGGLFDHIDLDSHLNLYPDPAGGAPILDGIITPTDHPGHGGHLLHA